MRWLIGVVVVLGLVAGGFAVGIAIGDEEDEGATAPATTTSTEVAGSANPGTQLIIQATEGTYEDGTLTLRVPSHAAFVTPLINSVVSLEDIDDAFGAGGTARATLQVAGEGDQVELSVSDLEFEGGEVTAEVQGDEPPASFLQAILFVESPS